MSGILIITTGGTIDKLYHDALSDYHVGESVAERLLSTARVTRPFAVREVMRKDSLDLTADDRAVIASAVADAAESKIIITHGTDTMTDTAEALIGLTDKTIVFVGALSPARFAESDAAFNLGMAFAAAQLAPSGVYIAMSGTIFAAGSVRKDRAVDGFVGVEA